MSHICQYCDKSFSTKGVLKTHQETAKYCLNLRNNFNVINNEETNDNKCEYCNKILTTKFKLDSHKKICRSQDLYQKFIELQNQYHDYKLITEEKNKFYEEQLKYKENELSKAFDNIHNMQKQIQELASLAIDKPNTINNHNLNNNSNNKMIDNRVLNMIPLDLDQENLKKTLEEKFTENHLINGQKGVAQFFVDHYLVTEDKKYMIKCTDPSRKMFIYLDNEGKIHKDVNGFKFTKNISDPVIEVTHNMLNELPEKYPDDNGRIDYATMKFMEIANIKHDNNEFIKNLIPPLITKS